jgi:ABC-type multidrug transport system fused ATPase/permease subunit
LLFLGPFCKAIGDGQCYKRGRHIGIRVKAIIIAATFNKSLNIDLNLSNEGIGSINNFISSDTSDIQEFMAYSHQLWSTPIEMLICIIILFFVLGIAALGGVIIMIVAILFGLYLGKQLQLNQVLKLKHSDNRMRIVNELLNSIRIIKLFAWESAYQDKVGQIRADELKNLRNMSIINALMLAIWEIVPVLVSACAFIIHVSS